MRWWGWPHHFNFWCVCPCLPCHPPTNHLQAPSQPPTTTFQPQQLPNKHHTNATSPHKPTAHPVDCHVTHSNDPRPHKYVAQPPHHLTPPLFEGCGCYLHPHHTAATNNKKSRDSGVIPAVSSIQTHECGGPRMLLPQPAVPMNAGAATNSAHECQRHCQQYPPTLALLPTSNSHAPMLACLLTKVISGEHLYFSLPNFLFHHIVHVLISLLKYN